MVCSEHLKMLKKFIMVEKHKYNIEEEYIMSEKQRFEYNYKTGRICDNESNFQCTSNMLHIVRRLNNLDEKCKKLEHQLHSLNGLYASDQEDMSEPFRLDFSKILQE